MEVTMPTYDYKCPSCNTIREEVHSMKEYPIFTCEKCDSKEPMERLISFNPGGFNKHLHI